MKNKFVLLATAFVVAFGWSCQKSATHHSNLRVKDSVLLSVIDTFQISRPVEAVTGSPQKDREKEELLTITEESKVSSYRSNTGQNGKFNALKRAKMAGSTANYGTGDDLMSVNSPSYEAYQATPAFNTESYNVVKENDFLAAKENPLSTFSIDVDAASYANSRRYLENGALPPTDAVRIEEFINYFDYSYPQPQGEHPFSFHTEIAACPWNSKHQLVHIGMQGKRIPFEQIAPMNLVFLIDVSGSMGDANKLPLLKKSFSLLTSKLRIEDRVAIVVYAGAAGCVLPSTPGNEKATIVAALDRLEAGGSTAGGEGIKLAYAIAKENFLENGLNRVIIATDGDFNIGASSDAEMTRLIEARRDDGIFLTSLGFGMGNYKDSKMESIADNGNGNYFYIDNIDEARKVLVTQLDGTLYTIAKDVKLQIEFNSAKVKAYRLVGYENRMLKKEDFNNDKKDAGELGAGHTVTALYEIIPTGFEETTYAVDPLRYSTPTLVKAKSTDELMTLKFRYKNPKKQLAN